MSQNDALRPRFHGSSPSIAREDASSSARSFSTCFRCVLQRILSVAPVRRIRPSIFLQLDVAYLFSAPGWSVFYALGLAKTPPQLQCDSPALCLPQSTSPSWSPPPSDLGYNPSAKFNYFPHPQWLTTICLPLKIVFDGRGGPHGLRTGLESAIPILSSTADVLPGQRRSHPRQ